MRHSLTDELRLLQQRIVQMGQLVTEMVESATLSLNQRDAELARRVIAADDQIDRMMIELEMRSLQLLALRQPFARDLRSVGTGLKLVTDLERMADHATTIAKATLKLEGEPLRTPLFEIPHMGALAEEMTRQALAAYLEEDTALAHQMIDEDHRMDRMYRTTFDQLLEIMQTDPSSARQATYLLRVAMSLERIGDHATNLGEWIIYMLTGELKALNT